MCHILILIFLTCIFIFQSGAHVPGRSRCLLILIGLLWIRWWFWPFDPSPTHCWMRSICFILSWILVIIFVTFFSCLWFTAWCATHSSSSCKCPLQSTTQTLIFSFLIINLTNLPILMKIQCPAKWPISFHWKILHRFSTLLHWLTTSCDISSPCQLICLCTS